MAWCRDGDENSSLFHQAIKSKRLPKTVYAIFDSDSVWRETVEELSKAFLDYY